MRKTARTSFRGVVIAVIAAACLIASPLIALAASHADIPGHHGSPYPGTNNQFDSDPAYLNLDVVAWQKIKASLTNLYWTQTSIDWIRTWTDGNRRQPSMVFHALRAHGAECTPGYYESYYSQLPGNWGYHKPGAIGCNDNELRVGVGLPWNLVSYTRYYTEVTWVDTTPYGTDGEIDFDNYWLDTAGGQPGTPINRDNQAKLCFGLNDVFQPNQSGFTCP